MWRGSRSVLYRSIMIIVYVDIMELKRMMEKLGQAKTHLELKKMIAEVDTTNSGMLRLRATL